MNTTNGATCSQKLPEPPPYQPIYAIRAVRRLWNFLVILGVTKEPEFSTLKPAKELAERHYNKRGREIWRRQYERTAPTSRKIQMIKHLRSMTMLLGKL